MQKPLVVWDLNVEINPEEFYVQFFWLKNFSKENQNLFL